IGFATLSVFYIWGSIHGLTLAFGSGLVGISMDYAFHGWPKSHRSDVWKSNLISFMPTLIAFSLLLFFSVPLIQQMSLFAISGLSFSFALTYIISILWPPSRRPTELKIPIISSGKPFLQFSFLSLIFISSLVVMMNIKADFSLTSMDVTQQKDAQWLQETGQQSEKDQYAFVLQKNIQEEDKAHTWAIRHRLPILGPASVRGSSISYKANREQWVTFVCSLFFKDWTVRTKKKYQVFNEFISSLSCDAFSESFKLENSRYLDIFRDQEKSLSILKVAQPDKIEKLKKEFPDSFFTKDLTEEFPRKMKNEIVWFMSLSSLLVVIVLIAFFRKWALLPLFPLMGSLSFVIFFYAVIDHPISFISFVSLIILIGLTLDYGIFCTSSFKYKKPWPGTLGSILLSAMTSLAGFAPLSISTHPVLRDMGLTIALGVSGALVFTILSYPALRRAHD
ncbi:MAG: hypothetical protein HRT44_12110, partial [Bdellovibrionales bacterium]|nr:hypothetical protein [Bdellovibrionales bacterium]NQZ19983.1 hypothetical protein [Bdellovibrionales bacterium]